MSWQGLLLSGESRGYPVACSIVGTANSSANRADNYSVSPLVYSVITAHCETTQGGDESCDHSLITGFRCHFGSSNFDTTYSFGGKLEQNLLARMRSLGGLADSEISRTMVHPDYLDLHALLHGSFLSFF